MTREQDFPDFSRDTSIGEKSHHAGNMPENEGGEKPVVGAPTGPIDQIAENLTPPDTIPEDLIAENAALRARAEAAEKAFKAKEEQIEQATPKHGKRTIAITTLAVLALGGGIFGVIKANQGNDKAATSPLPKETSTSQPYQGPVNPSVIDETSSTVSIESSSVPTQSSESNENQPLADPNLAPVIVPVDQAEKINESNASAILGILLNNELHAEETGNEDAYRAAFAQQSPDYYGNLEDIVDAGREKSRAFIAALTNDPNYPEQSTTVASINSITPSNDGESVTVGATVKNENVYPATQENGQLGPKVQKDTTTAAFVLKKANVTNFSNGSSEKIWVIEDIIGYTTVIE